MKNLKGFVSTITLSLIFSAAAFGQTVLTSLDGSKVNVEGQTGKVVVLAVGAVWVQLSGKQAEFTNLLAKKYAGKDVVVYFVATDSSNPKSKNYASMETIQKFVSTSKLNVSVLHDGDGAILKKFKIDQVPSFIILDKSGKLAGEQFGGITTDAKYDVTVPIGKVIDRLL